VAGAELLRGRDPASVAIMAEDILGPNPEDKALEALYADTGQGLDTLASPGKPDSQGLMDRLRSRILEQGQPLVVEPAPGRQVSIPLSRLLEAARAIEKWNYSGFATEDRDLPGWALSDPLPRRGEEAMRDLLEGTAGEIVERDVLVYASALRRSVDFRATQAALFLEAMAKRVAEAQALRFPFHPAQAEEKLAALKRLSPGQAKEIQGLLSRASCWLRQEFKLEGKKLEKRLK